MKWFVNILNGYEYWYVELDDDSSYSVSIYDTYAGWCAGYNPPGKVGGYLSSSLRIECGYGMAEAMGLKPNCCFTTKEEAQSICERHYNLLVLQ